MIKPIETMYRGYRFRSRLETRWAVALEESDIAWVYEPEGFETKQGTKVLPDFYIPKHDLYLEVKPEYEYYQTYSNLPRVYMAGKMGDPYDNKLPGDCWRTFTNHDVYHDASDLPEMSVYTHKSKQFLYTGPFKARGDYHGWEHGVTTCGGCYSREIFDAAMQGIDFCEYVLCYINTKDCFGTLFELGYAHAIEKKVIIAVDECLATNNTTEFLPVDSWANDMWFSCMPPHTRALWFNKDRDGDVVDFLLSKIPYAAEFSKDIALLDVREQLNYAIVFGDPMEHFLVSKELASCMRPYTLNIISDKAKLKARQARFEYGTDL